MREKFNLDRLKRIIKWLYPGIGIKRWISVSILGIILLVIGGLSLNKESIFIW